MVRLLTGLLCLGGVLPQWVAAEDYVGIIEPWQVIRVGSPVVGIVETIPVDRGDTIAVGTLLAQLNAEIEQVDYALAKARYLVAKSRYDRQVHLQKNSLTSEEQIETTRNELELSGLQMERIGLLLKQKRIVSPIEGVVTRRLVKSGEYVYEQVPVVEVAQMNPLSVELLVPFAAFGTIKPGMRSEIQVEEPIGGRYIAEVDVVDQVMDAASSTFGVRLKLENPDGDIPSGVKCKVKFSSSKDLSSISADKSVDSHSLNHERNKGD